MRVHAFAALKAKSQLQPFQYDAPLLGIHDVEIKVSHCGICHSDIHLIDNDWMISQYPLIPGHEIIGTVTAIGKAVKELKIGQRVGVGWQSESCGNCEWCNTGQENLCKENKATCVGRPGGFADMVYTDHRFAFSIPVNLESETAAPLLCGGITVYSPIRIYGVKPHHRVGIIGIGGLGHIALQFAKAIGCDVAAFPTSPSKQPDALRLGATEFINSKDDKQMKKHIGSFDFILSTVTAPLNWTTFVNLLKPNGKLNFVGAMVGNLEIPVGMLVIGQKSVSGSVIGGRAMIQEMLFFAARHGIKAQTELFRLSDVNAAIEKVRNNQARYRMVLQAG
jgi:alcohol/geraniol dehydrogenase (NADP+)